MDNHEKENALNIVTDERTYQIYAESPEDARYVVYTYSKEVITKLWLSCNPATVSLCKTDLWGQSSPLWLPVELHTVIFNSMFAESHFLNSL